MDDDYDTPWKEVLTRHFPEFMAFYFPDAHAAIAWSRPHVFLDQELAALARDAELGKRLLDKLVSVCTLDGREQWVLLHIEIQGWHDRNFSERMFVYNYRVFDRYRRPVASMALLTDAGRHWRPAGFGWHLLGCTMQLDFPIAKMQDYAGRIDQLLEDDNPFGLVTVAHLLTQQTRGDDHRRRVAKWRLTKLLYQRRWDKQRIIDLYRIIDWIMRLPVELEKRIRSGILQLERRSVMPYLSSMERIGMEIGRTEGLQQGLQEGLQTGVQKGQRHVLAMLLNERFGTLDATTENKLATADLDQLARWVKNFVHASSIDDVFRPE